MSISVVIPCYRCTATISRAIASVAAQTLRPQEVILVDDASHDGTLAELHRLQQHYGTDWITVLAQTENQGPGVARNKGWNAATSEFIAFLDADDSWHPEKLALQRAQFEHYPHFAGLGHRVSVVDTGQQAKHDKTTSEQLKVSQVSFAQLLRSNVFVTSSMMLRREITERFAEDKYYSEDYLLWLTLVAQGVNLGTSNAQLTYQYKLAFGAGGLTGNVLNMHRGERDNFTRLYRQGYLSLMSYFTSRVRLAFKLCKRGVLLGVRKLRFKA